MGIDPVALSVLGQRMAGIAEQMGAVLERSACSPNIKERRDFSCALFDGQGRLLAQAAHIPVHLGSLESSVRAAAPLLRNHPGEMVVLNDPFAGGTHLPDITVVASLAPDAGGSPLAYLANRAHHADVGGGTPGSLPAGARYLEEEGLVLSPTLLTRDGEPVDEVWQGIARASHTPRERFGDLQAQLATNAWGLQRLLPHVRAPQWQTLATELLEATQRAARSTLAKLPPGVYPASEVIHDHLGRPHKLMVSVACDGAGGLEFDFAGTGDQYSGNLNAPPAVTQAAVNYVGYCLLQALEPTGPPMANHGAFASLKLDLPLGSLLNPDPGERPPAVSAGNVETSQRIVDLLLAALAPALPGIIPAQSQGTMNNLLIGGSGSAGTSSSGAVRGGEPFAYYETLGGGCGATPTVDGACGTHSHMTNTLNTPVEALEHAYPLRVEAYRLRTGTGGHGQHRGGDGLERWIRLLAPSATLTLVSGRRTTQPQGLNVRSPGPEVVRRTSSHYASKPAPKPASNPASERAPASGAGPGLPGEQWVQRDGECLPIPAKVTMELKEGDVVVVRTPGGGGWSRD